MATKAKTESIEQQPEVVENPKPKPTDPAWQEYVLGHLTEDELMNGNPTTDGLRRIAPLVLGSYIYGKAKVAQSPNQQNGMVATVEYTVGVGNDTLVYFGESYTDCADASPQNCNPPFSLHPTAMASTRAEGRALRKLLKLRKVATAEELDTPRDIKDNEGNPTYINFSQFSALKTLFKKNGLNGAKYINKYTEKYHSAKYPITQIPYPIAVELIKHVQKWSQGKSPEDVPVPPEDVQGYDDNFENEWTT